MFAKSFLPSIFFILGEVRDNALRVGFFRQAQLGLVWSHFQTITFKLSMKPIPDVTHFGFQYRLEDV